MSPQALAKLIAQSALSQLKVAVDLGLVLSVDTAEGLAIAIGAGAAQNLVFLAAEVPQEQPGVEWAADAERLHGGRR